MNDAVADHAGGWREVFLASLRLGVSSFGGPIAHLGYFERSYVQTRRWLSSADYAALVGLCQLLPGPTSSQVGFLIGYRRAGWPGAVAAFVGFTLPSALLMYAFAALAKHSGFPGLSAMVHGLMLAAVMVVAQAVWNMSRQLCPDPPRMAIAVGSALVLLLIPSPGAQVLSMLLGGASGLLLCRRVPMPSVALSKLPGKHMALIALALLAVLLLGLSLAAHRWPHDLGALASALARAGAFVFGGGHVVLPLLHEQLIGQGWVDDPTFLTGYGFAQALPGPLFSFATFIGASAAPAHTAPLWALAAVLAVFLPGLLLAVAASWIWSRLAAVDGAHSILAGVNASVVGILAAALYQPVMMSAVHSFGDALGAFLGFVILQRFRVWPIWVVAGSVAASAAGAWLSAA